MNFESVYKKYYWLVEVNAKKFSKTSGEDAEELESFLNTEMWLIYQNYEKDKGCLERFLNISMQGKLINYLERRNNELNRQATPFSGLEDKDDEGKRKPFDKKSDYNLLDHVLERVSGIKTDADKRQLVDALLRNADSITTAIAHEILENDDARPTAIGRKLGIHHQTVRRKLDALSRKYYANHDEDIYEYLAV